MKKSLTVLLICGVGWGVFMGCAGCLSSPGTEYDLIQRAKKNRFTLLNQSAELHQIVLIGDSIIELFPTDELYAGNAKKVYNRGISGDTADRLAERLSDNALSIAPSTLCILIGTNDIGRQRAFDAILSDIAAILAAAKASGVPRIVLQSIYPVNPSINPGMVGRRTNAAIQKVNAALRQLCEAESVSYANLFDCLTDPEGNLDSALTSDGLHPNAQGYLAIQAALQGFLQ